MKLLLSSLLCILIAAATNAQQPRITKTQGAGRHANVHCALQDRNDLIWFGTTGEGLYQYDGKNFTNLTIKDGLPSNSIYPLLQDKDGTIWFGTQTGLYRYNGKTYTSVPISTVYSAHIPITTSAPRCMLQDKNGSIWVGTNKGIYIYRNGYFTQFAHNDKAVNPSGLQFIEVQSIMQDSHGNIWLTTWFDGVCMFNGKTITQFKPNNEVWFSALTEDKQGNIWIGRRDKGAVIYNNGKFTNIRQHGLFDTCGVGPMITDRAGNVWIGTESGPLTLRDEVGGAWRYNGKTFTNYTTKDGLPHIAVFTILEDTAGNIWFGTRNTGICRYDGKKITNFSE